MRKSISQLGFSRIANTQVNRLEQFDKLKEIANRNNYPHKIKQLTAKVQEEYNFWNIKNPSRNYRGIQQGPWFSRSIQIDCKIYRQAGRTRKKTAYL